MLQNDRQHTITTPPALAHYPLSDSLNKENPGEPFYDFFRDGRTHLDFPLHREPQLTGENRVVDYRVRVEKLTKYFSFGRTICQLFLPLHFVSVERLSVPILRQIVVHFSAPVIVTGTPALKLETGVADREASWINTTNTNSSAAEDGSVAREVDDDDSMLLFEYVVVTGDSADDLDYWSDEEVTVQKKNVFFCSSLSRMSKKMRGKVDK